jgi:hypothetical protein
LSGALGVVIGVASVISMVALGNGAQQAVKGERMRIAGRQFTVMGVMARKGTNAFGDADEQILIPFQTGRFAIFGTDRVNDIWALVGSEDSIPSAMGEIQSAVRRSHRLRQDQKAGGHRRSYTLLCRARG